MSTTHKHPVQIHSDPRNSCSASEEKSDKFNDECGVFGIFNHPDASAMSALGLHALQHRGQECCGIVTFDGENFYSRREFGLVDSVFNSQSVIDQLKGSIAIGHNRYSTSGGTSERNIQPFYADLDFGGFAVAHNGNLTNSLTLRDKLVQEGSIFHSTSDTEVIIHLVAKENDQSVQTRLVNALKQVKGAYSLVACAESMVIGVRDPSGIRPLSLGKIETEGNTSYILTSETCALDIIGATYVRDVEAGEMVVLDKDGVHSSFPLEKVSPRFCIFEYIYFARPDSFMEGRSVYAMRKNIGAELAKEEPVPNADFVIPVPDSGVPAAIGYAQESGIPFELGIIRNHYVGRTFIQPTDKIRHLGVKMKHNANKLFLKDKVVVLIDDSIVRGTTSRKIVEMVRKAGAKEVHMRISSPPTKYSCFYGIDTPSSEELLANKKSVEEICEFIGTDSLAYISMDGLHQSIIKTKRDMNNPQFCDACFSGDYPVELTDNDTKKSDRITNLGGGCGKSC